MTERPKLILLVACLVMSGTSAHVQQAIPKTWEERELTSFELPLVTSDASPRHISADYYDRIPVRPIYKSYPIYAPGHEPAGYMEWLADQEPVIAFDAARVQSEADWIATGDLVFDAPIGYGATFKLPQVRDPQWYERHGVPVTKDGVMPFSRYVIRQKGVVEVGTGSCLMCHARVLPDGTLVKGAQGNFPVDRVLGANLRQQAAEAKDPAAFLQAIRLGQRAFYAMPWLRPDPAARVETMSLEEIAAAYEAIPPGVSTRVNLSLFAPAQIPDLIGIADIRHLDHTGIILHRSIADLMRYVALVQGANSLDRFGVFALLDPLPDPNRLQRYSDEQLYALAKFLYSLKRPPNPHVFDPLAERGQQVFSREGCGNCHRPPLYTSNALTPVDGFQVPPEHLQRYQIINRSVGTDPELALRTRKGTGYYKVPSLRGVWYRGPFQHSGAVRTLEKWFEPARLSTVPGHPFGLDLSPEDRRALIAFLRTL